VRKKLGRTLYDQRLGFDVEVGLNVYTDKH
jgi:hypothetical protein